jgi:hypothetical protein
MGRCLFHAAFQALLPGAAQNPGQCQDSGKDQGALPFYSLQSSQLQAPTNS